MRHIIFDEADTYRIALLIKGSAFNKHELASNYVQPLVKAGVAEREVIAFTAEYNSDGKAPAKFIKEYLGQLMPVLESLQVKYLYVADSNYFKVLAGQSKAEPHYGYILPCKLKGYEHIQVVLGLNHQALIYNPDLQAKLDLSLTTLASGVAGNYQAIGSNIIHHAEYPKTEQEIKAALQRLHKMPKLSCDIECFSLRHHRAGIGTIAFAWDQNNGIAFACDYRPHKQVDTANSPHGYYGPNAHVRKLLKEFFSTYNGELTFHNATFDVKIIIATLYMDNLLDTEGLLTGLDIMTRSLQDTKIIAYLATNSTAGNVLGLKSLAHEFAGNWAKEDIKNIGAIPLDELLQYNLIDALSTNYVKEKYYPIMVQDNQEQLYYDLMLPSLKLIIQIELTGMPLSRNKVRQAKIKLETIQQNHLNVIQNSVLIKTLNLLLQTHAMESANAKLKTKQHPLEKFSDVAFNPNSGPQLQRLLYELMGLPVLDLTDTKQPATGADTLEKLIHHTQDLLQKELLEALIGYGKVTKILSTFIPAFEEAMYKDVSDTVWLHGSFNLGGTVSGRLSSSDPNLQNIPAGSVYGKLIKECFVAPDNWLFAGADFNSLTI